MQHIFIKKAEKGYDFAFSNSFFLKKWDLNSFPFLETSLQIVENQHSPIYVFFSKTSSRAKMYLKILFNEKLKEVKEISSYFIINDLIPDMIQEMKKIYRLKILEDSVRLDGQVIMIMEEKAFIIVNDFSVSEIDSFFDQTATIYKIIEKEKNFSSLNDFFHFIANDDLESNIEIMYPYFFGNTFEKEILMENKEGAKFFLSREEFIWHF